MRTWLFILIMIVIVVGIVLMRRSEHGGDIEEDATPDLVNRLSQASIAFRKAVETLRPERRALRAAITDLARQCESLAVRETDGNHLGSAAHRNVVRLLLALQEVIDRITALARHIPTETTDALLDSATALIVSATDSLNVIVDRVDEANLRHLEADLDVLRERLESVE